MRLLIDLTWMPGHYIWEKEKERESDEGELKDWEMEFDLNNMRDHEKYDLKSLHKVFRSVIQYPVITKCF